MLRGPSRRRHGLRPSNCTGCSIRTDWCAEPSKLKCSANELLGVHEILRYILALRVQRVDELHVTIASFDPACNVLDLLLAAKWSAMQVCNLVADLQHTIGHHLPLKHEAYGEGGIKPKRH
jgi:hypothetical protein